MDNMNIEQKKKLCINTAVCDMTEVSEESLKAYDSIEINAAVIFVSPQTRQMISRYKIEINAASVYEVPPGTVASVKNGSFTISPGPPPVQQTFLVANGSVFIESGTENIIASYAGMVINGQVTAPDSMSGLLSGATINGTIVFYPNGAVMLGKLFKLDRSFILRAKASKYYACKLIMLDVGLDFDRLISSGASFSGEIALVAEGLLEQLAPLIDEKTKIEILPDGCGYFDDKVEVDSQSYRRLGNRLYIDDDLRINDGAEAFIETLEFLKVTGQISLPENMLDAFYRLNAQYEKLEITKPRKGHQIHHTFCAVITDSLVKMHGFISVYDCAQVRLTEDLAPGIIESSLNITDCGNVICTPQQEAAVRTICTRVMFIGPEGGNKTGRPPIPHNADEDEDWDEDGEDADVVEINTANYKM